MSLKTLLLFLAAAALSFAILDGGEDATMTLEDTLGDPVETTQL